MNCDGDVPLDIALDETTECLLQDYTLKQGNVSPFAFPNPLKLKAARCLDHTQLVLFHDHCGDMCMERGITEPTSVFIAYNP